MAKSLAKRYIKIVEIYTKTMHKTIFKLLMDGVAYMENRALLSGKGHLKFSCLL